MNINQGIDKFLDLVLTNKKIILKTIKYIAIVLLGFLLLFLVFRNTLLNYFLNQQVANFSSKYNISIEVQEANFSGFKSVEVNNISVAKNSESEKLLHIGSVNATVSLFELLSTNIRFTSLSIDTLNVVLYKDKERDNFSFLLKSNKEEKEEKTSTSVNYAETLHNLMNLAFDVVPANFSVNEFGVKINYDSLNLKVTTPSITIREQIFKSEFTLVENLDTSIWHIEGNINNISKNLQIKYYSNQKGIVFPLLKQQYELTLSCDTMYYSLTSFDFKDGKLQLNGVAQIHDFAINHWRISPKTVELKSFEVDYQITVGNNYFQVDSISQVLLNKINFNSFVKVGFDNYKSFALKIKTPKMESQDFFESLPIGLFTNLEGIKTAGQLQYNLDFNFDTKHPEQLVFNSTLTPTQFKIKAYGETNLSKMSDEFTYTVYEGDRMMRNFLVGPNNPNFTPLNNISLYFQNALMSSEDGSFYYHKGFNEKRFGQSIAENYKQKRFVRGASTISMQLVKNVFLRRNKTIARKLEEAIIVWLIENNRLTTKARMYEVYLNVIEFGPNVYGIGEAANFYFSKKPADLTIEESIFLAMIVPRPKWFMYHFNEQGSLKENTQGYFNLISGILLNKGLITAEQQQTNVSNLVLAPLAKSYVVKNDTLVPIEVQEEIIPPSE